MAVKGATRLGCGRDVDEVWAHVGEPPTPHEQSCPDCTKARAELAELSAATHELRDADREDPALRVPEGVLTGLLDLVSAEVRRGRMVPLTRTLDPEPTLSVSEEVIASVVREVADRLTDVEVRRVAVAVPAVEAESPEPADITLRLQLTVAPRVSIPRLLERLRGAIRDEVTSLVGPTVSRIDVAVEDVHNV
jgi:uncharacterized alkaline shock family protein YloU